MDDRELLELAAEAAELKVVWNEHWQCFQHVNPPADDHGRFRHGWIPLIDDGDALRLAVKLKMMVSHFPFNDVHVRIDGDGRTNTIALMEAYGDDPCAATRRAIVRAAAEIGKTLGVVQ